MGTSPIVDAIITLSFWVLIGIFNIAIGLSIKKRGIQEAPFVGGYDRDFWQKQIEKWNVASQAKDVARLTDEVMNCWGQMYYRGQIYSGAALILTILYYIISLIITGSKPPLGAWPYWTGFILSYLIGQGLGYIVGVYRMRNATSHVIRYGDLRPRKLSDYRSRALLLVAVAFVLYVFIVTFVLLPSLGPTLDGPGVGLSVKVPTTIWAVWVGPISLLLIFIVCEMFMVRIAELPRLLITTDPATAQRADEMLRARVLGMIEATELYALAFLSFLQWSLLSNSLISSHPPLLVITLSFIILLAVLGIALPTLFKNRIGGRVTGWPWQPPGGVE